MRERVVLRLAAVTVAFLALGPVLLQRGVVLVGDMSFVPDQPWRAAWLAWDGSVPRAVPADALVWLIELVLPADLLQKAVLAGSLVAAALGAASLLRLLVPRVDRWGRLAAAVMFGWNPFVAERLGIGHWGVLLGYAALPWALAGAARVAAGDRSGWRPLGLALLTAAVASPTSGLLVSVSAMLVAGWTARSRPRATARPAVRFLVLLSAAAVAINIPWWLPGLSSGSSDPAGVVGFAARSDSPTGVLGSLLGLGGIWKQSVVPDERAAWTVAGTAALVGVLGLLCLALLARRAGTGPLRALLLLGTAGLLLAWVPATGAGEPVVRWLVEYVPGAGLWRDSQKYLLPTALAVAVGFGAAVSSATQWLRRRQWPAGLLGVAATVLPVLLAPSLAWGLNGTLHPVRFPSDWAEVRTALESVPADQRSTVVLPWSNYQAYPWNRYRATIDPARRFFPGRVLIDDTLRLDAGVVIEGEDPDAAAITAALADGEALAPVLHRLGIRFVLLETSAAGFDATQAPPGRVVVRGPDLTLLDIGGDSIQPRADDLGLLIAGDLIALGAALALGAAAVAGRGRRGTGPDPADPSAGAEPSGSVPGADS